MGNAGHKKLNAELHYREGHRQDEKLVEQWCIGRHKLWQERAKK